MAVFLFFGNDIYSHQEKLKFWRKEFEKKYNGDINVSVLLGKDVAANQIFQTCCSMPFLAEKRFTVVKDFLSEAQDAEKLAMLDLIEKIPDFCILIFSEIKEPDRRTSLFKKIQKIGKIAEFPTMTGSKLLGWIEKNAEKRGGAIEKEAVIFLSELSNGDLYRLENEIAKLIGYAANRPISKKDVELLMDTQFSMSIFRLTDGIGQKNKKVALDTLHNLIDTGENLYHILYMIRRQFRIITCVKDLSEQGMRHDEITAKLKAHPFVISNTIPQTRNFTLKQLKHAYQLLIDIDAKRKSGGIKVLKGDNRELVLAMDRLVLDLCN